MISKAASAVFIVIGSPKNTAAKTMAMATLSLSTGATWLTRPSCKALK